MKPQKKNKITITIKNNLSTEEKEQQTKNKQMANCLNIKIDHRSITI